MIDNDGKQPAIGRREWIEPEVAELNVMETQGFPGRGADGGLPPDCTRS